MDTLKQSIRTMLFDFSVDANNHGYKNVLDKHVGLFLEQFYQSLDGRLKKIEEKL